MLDVLDALVRKSLLVADRSSGRTRFSMLETIRQFAEEQLVARGEATEARTAHARYFAGREADIMALWDSPRQREAYTWFTAELANLRTAFRWAADHDDLDVAATIATYAGFLGYLSKIMSRWPGQKSSSNLPGPSTIRGSGSCTWWRRSATWPDASRQLSATATPARRLSAMAATRCPCLRPPGLDRRCVLLHRPARTGS